VSYDKHARDSRTGRESADGVVKGSTAVEATSGSIAEPLDEPGDHAVGTQRRVPLSIGVEIDAQEVADEHVGVADEAVVADECRRRTVWIGVIEPELDVFVFS